ncbi:MAG: aminotransferase class I/II-fold pyridoxal phosphate-dependent enzyme [Alistipes sp.]|nr:aminotransferase class I/II-fold pyridoxal phosphate-dependent enzyme [Alistipes sp.]
MQHFDSDYMEGMHPRILEAFERTNMQKTTGYGLDEYSVAAREAVRRACSAPDAEVHFLVGGTQTNATVIKALLRPHEGVIAAATGHIAVHESGAIEASGHKVLTLDHLCGKISAEQVEQYMQQFYADESFEHMVFPGMVYVSLPTEYGTLYTLAELEALAEVCHKWKLHLFVDGARLGYGLAARECDITLADLARLCDAFYIGGTKCGAMFGEAVVMRKGLVPHFFTIIKQQGALLAKGRMLGVQFLTLMSDGLYLDIARHAVVEAQRLKRAFVERGYELYFNSPTNQVFVVLDSIQEERLRLATSFTEWERLDDGRLVVRLATSWATRPEDIDELIASL